MRSGTVEHLLPLRGAAVHPWPELRLQIQSLVSLLRQAYELGQRAKLCQIQNMLGIK